MGHVTLFAGLLDNLLPPHSFFLLPPPHTLGRSLLLTPSGLLVSRGNRSADGFILDGLVQGCALYRHVDVQSPSPLQKVLHLVFDVAAVEDLNHVRSVLDILAEEFPWYQQAYMIMLDNY